MEKRPHQPIFFIDDEEHIRIATAQMLELEGYEVTTFSNAKAALQQLDTQWPGIVISDIRMPEMDGMAFMRKAQALDPDLPIVLVTGHGDITMAIKAIREGAYDFLEKPFHNEMLFDIVTRAFEKRSLVLENRKLRKVLEEQTDQKLIGLTPVMQALKEKIHRLATTQADVLINGLTGTGKELVAHSLHQNSPRKDKPFVAVNCAAIPETMIESVLFGHEAGSFTGAQKRHIGKFEHAQGGTLFLDEIESMPLTLAAKILRVLQERVVERLGSHTPIPLDLRIIAATKADLKELSEQGAFRQDLYYRLNVVELHLPPLADRREDIPLLFEHFTTLASQRYQLEKPTVSAALIAQLMAHDWPGNVRELRNAADRFVVGSEVSQFDLTQFTGKLGQEPGLTLPQRVERFEKALIEQELKRQKGSIQNTYQALGLPRKTLYDKLNKYQLRREDFLS